MANVVWGILVFVLLVLAIVQEGIMFHYINHNMNSDRMRKVVFLLCSILNIVWMMWAVVLWMSILTFLTGLFVSFFISLSMYKEKFNWIIFCQMKFVVLTAVVLICLGIACFFGTTIYEVSHTREVRLFAVLGAKVAELIYIKLYTFYFVKDSNNVERDKKKIGVFQCFLLSCLGYIYVDGILAIYDFGEDFVPALLISGNVLILVLMFLFYRFDYVMEQKEYLEKENQLLEEEKARGLWKAEQLKSMAEKDALTSAYSRRYVIQKTDSLRQENVPFLVIYIDMDGMKVINDTRGHQAGDIYLKNFVSNFSDKLRQDDFIARIGGDEFLVILYRCNAEDGKRRMEEISRLLPEYSFSYGIASEGNSVEAMIEKADISMYDLKKQKSGRDMR